MLARDLPTGVYHWRAAEQAHGHHLCRWVRRGGCFVLRGFAGEFRTLVPRGQHEDREDRAEPEQRGRDREGQGVAVGRGGPRRLRAGLVGDEVAGRRARRDRAEYGDADRSANLLHRVDQRRGDARVLTRYAGRSRVDRRREDHAEAQAHDDQGGQHAAEVTRGDGELGQVGGPAGAEQHARGDQGAGPDLGQGAVQGGGDQDPSGQRQEQQPGGQRAVSLDLLHVEGEEKENAEERDSGNADRDVGAAPRSVEDDPQRQQRVTGPLLGDDESGKQDRAQDQGAEGQRGGPGGRLGVGEAEDDEEQPGAGQHGPRPVHPRRVGRAAAADVRQGAGRGYRGEDQVDEQRVTPGQVLGEHPAEYQAHGGAADGDRAEDSERPVPFTRVLKRADEGAERGWREDGAEGALQRPGNHEHHE